MNKVNQIRLKVAAGMLLIVSSVLAGNGITLAIFQYMNLPEFPFPPLLCLGSIIGLGGLGMGMSLRLLYLADIDP